MSSRSAESFSTQHCLPRDFPCIWLLLMAACLGPVGTVCPATAALADDTTDPRNATSEADSAAACWAEAMAAARGQYLAHPSKGLDARLLHHLWSQLATDYPQATKWFAQDARNKHLDYFSPDGPSHLAKQVVQQRMSSCGAAGAVLRVQFEQLVEEKVPDEHVRWLQLYWRSCQVSRCQPGLDRIWIVELREPLEQELIDMARQAVNEPEPWTEHITLIDDVAEQLPAGRELAVAEVGLSLAELQKHCPTEMPQAAALRTRWVAENVAWLQVLTAVAQGDSQALVRLATVAEQIQAFERDMLLSMAGMADFLDSPAHRAMQGEWQQQYADLLTDIGNRAHFQRVAGEVYRAESLIQPGDRDPLDVVLRRTRALLADRNRMEDAHQLEGFAHRLRSLESANERLAVARSEARRLLYAAACRLRREIALSNPLLDFDDILFIKHHRALFNHMCDQYYGMAATPGGGLYVLADAFGPEPRVHDLLEKTVVGGDSRLAGQQLCGGPNELPTVSFDGQGNRHGREGQGGTFLSPDLSFDARRVVFAYVENQGDMQHRHHVDPGQGHWDAGRCFHLFSVNMDGSDLQQLTDGTWNDFDPCWLPNGRIAFVSERRGGYLRCGRVCPNYTLYDMASDGSDIQCLSFHETNEWHPSVTNEGQIIWTRWDYVDRHGCTAHMPWLTTLDGRDPRPVHGNYAPRPTRPDMEVDCRAIPGSHKFVATAAPHHGQAYGSLILIDPHVADDDGMGPVRRITPEVGFPESQGGGQVYGTPWALSEDYYLCVYDAHMRRGGGRQGGSFIRGDYGIYLVDAFGNRELLYRDPQIGALSPIPVRPRPLPPAPPELAHRGQGVNPATRATEPKSGARPVGTVAVMDVYDSLLPWPQGTKISALRVLQVFPMSVPSGRPPHDTGLRVASAGDSVVPVRHVLGTVPVEEDGSAHFEVPANIELFFQALDERGLAVQSMRSATQVREGERLVCAGCHNPRHESTPLLPSTPLALKRAPSQLVPDIDGSRPFSYPRLVQPVLDKHCVECHEENQPEAPKLGREPLHKNWYASYNSLVREFGFYDYQDGYRTTPGRFGARASKLLELLEGGHYDVALTPEEMYRLTLWLDCASMFYGVYEREEGQAQLRGEIAYPTLE